MGNGRLPAADVSYFEGYSFAKWERICYIRWFVALLLFGVMNLGIFLTIHRHRYKND